VAVTAEATIMAEPEVYLEKLSAFSRMLRREGLPIGPQETADAGRVLAQIGFADRNTVKIALQTVFAKSREEQLAFNKVFDGFFISEEAMKSQAQAQMQKEAEEAAIRQQAQEQFRVGDQPVELSDEQWQTYASMPESERQRLTKFMERYKGNAERNPKLYGDFIHSVFAKSILEQQMLMEDAALGVEAADPEIGMLYRDISQFKDTEIPKAIDMIQSIARRINGELEAKRRAGGHSGKLDFRRTIRKGLETGGSFYRLRYRKKPHRRKNLVLLCDVSGSMMQFSEFALRFIQSLNRVSENARVFLFSEEIFEADAFALENMDKFRQFVKDSGLYGRGTDLGTALDQLAAMKPTPLTASTTLMILSDTKTIDQNRAVAALLKAKQLSGRVIWLNPIPQNKWRYLRSVQTMASLCPMVPCSTLRELAAACRKLTDL
jgi:uncharacterized protein with von Willebrand factor type A (vWA) domain